jgi:hypothetical protein
LALNLEVPDMSSESAANSPPPDDTAKTRTPEWRPMRYVHDNGLGAVTTCTYLVDERPPLFRFTHDRAKGVFVVTNRDRTTERFRDNPARHVVVEPDPETGELRPAVKYGRPVYVYLCREQREL